MTDKQEIDSINKLISRLGVRRKVCETAYIHNGELSVNLSDLYTALIKDAAKCNRYSSDIVYSIEDIADVCRNYDEEEEYPPILIACRKDGVDHTGFILSRCDKGAIDVYRNYFAFYSVEFFPDEHGFVKIVWTEYIV